MIRLVMSRPRYSLSLLDFSLFSPQQALLAMLPPGTMVRRKNLFRQHQSQPTYARYEFNVSVGVRKVITSLTKNETSFTYP